MDSITDLHTYNYYDSILVIIYYCTKYNIYIYVTKSFDAISLSNVFIRDYFKRFGLPKFIISDSDKLFTSNYWKQFTSSFKLK
jgi:hypothetical protein